MDASSLATQAPPATLQFDGNNATVAMVHEVARNGCPVSVSPQGLEAMQASRDLLNRLVDEGRVIYGVTTGMGGMREFLVPDKVGPQMQSNLLRAVASNVGECFSEDVVRAAMFARLNSLCRGHSAIRVSTFQMLLDMLNSGVHPLVPMKGSLGASGDLGPLAAIALAAMGEGRAVYKGEVMPAHEALRRACIPPMQPHYKEGLALVNGTSMMTGLAALVMHDAQVLCESTEVVAALSVEGLAGRVGPFDERVHRQKPHPGQLETAVNLQRLTRGTRMAVTDEDLQSSLSKQHSSEVTRKSDMPIMDAYSIRCIPQVHGPVREYIEWGTEIVERELNSSNDDPLVVPEYGECFHNGHFHGQYIAMVMDSIAVAANTLGQLSDRRIDRFMDKNHSAGLPPFLCNGEMGIRLGLMGGQFLTSSLVAENRAQCVPISIQSITSTEDFQDFVSLGLVAGRRSNEVVRDTAYVIAFEAICAAQAADIRGADKLSPAGAKTYGLIRETVPFLDQDTCLTPLIEGIAKQIRKGRFCELHSGNGHSA